MSSGSATCRGVTSPADLTRRVATDLSKVRRELAPSLPTKGTPSVHRASRNAPSSPSPPCSTGTATGSAASSSWETSSAFTSTSSTPRLCFRSAAARRFPERSDTSRSWLRPPAITNTVMGSVSHGGCEQRPAAVHRSRPLAAGSCQVRAGSGGWVGVRWSVHAEGLQDLQLAPHHLGEALHPHRDPVWWWETVGQPHVT